MDHGEKKVGDIGECLFHKFVGVELEIIKTVEWDDVTEYESRDLNIEDVFWVKRTDGKKFEGLSYSAITRNDGKELILHKAHIKVISREWDKVSNK